MHWFSGKDRVPPGTGVPPLFRPRRVLWHLGQKQVKPSWHSRAEVLLLQQDANELQGNFRPTVGANPACTGCHVVGLSLSRDVDTARGYG